MNGQQQRTKRKETRRSKIDRREEREKQDRNKQAKSVATNKQNQLSARSIPFFPFDCYIELRAQVARYTVSHARMTACTLYCTDSMGRCCVLFLFCYAQYSQMIPTPDNWISSWPPCICRITSVRSTSLQVFKELGLFRFCISIDHNFLKCFQLKKSGLPIVR